MSETEPELSEGQARSWNQKKHKVEAGAVSRIGPALLKELEPELFKKSLELEPKLELVKGQSWGQSQNQGVPG